MYRLAVSAKSVLRMAGLLLASTTIAAANPTVKITVVNKGTAIATYNSGGSTTSCLGTADGPWSDIAKGDSLVRTITGSYDWPFSYSTSYDFKLPDLTYGEKGASCKFVVSRTTYAPDINGGGGEWKYPEVKVTKSGSAKCDYKFSNIKDTNVSHVNHNGDFDVELDLD